MNREQALRKIAEFCKDNGYAYRFNSSEGNGSHGTIYVGAKRTTAKHGEWSKLYLETILKQLGLPKKAV